MMSRTRSCQGLADSITAITSFSDSTPTRSPCSSTTGAELIRNRKKKSAVWPAVSTCRKQGTGLDMMSRANTPWKGSPSCNRAISLRSSSDREFHYAVAAVLFGDQQRLVRVVDERLAGRRVIQALRHAQAGRDVQRRVADRNRQVGDF